MRAFAILMGLAATAAQAQSVPEPIKARVNTLVAQCARAGGQLGQMTGQGQFVIPRDFTGDGRTDFLVSEGNFPCVGKPALFRPDGLARVELWIGEGQTARLGFADRLLAYRVLDGRPAKLQIARRAPQCGGPARCGDELRWNAGKGGFQEVATDGRAVAARPATGATVSATPVAAAASAGAAAAAPGATAGIPPVQSGAEAAFKARCRKETLAQNGPAASKWVDGHCTDMWGRAVAAQPLAEAMLAAVNAGAGPVDALRRATPMVRWGSRSEQGMLASGRIGSYMAGLSGKGRAESVSIGWMQVGAEIPVDVPAALEARGAKLGLTACEKLGAGEGERVWSVTFPGRTPFALTVFQRTAPTGDANSSYSAEAALDGRPARRGPTSCDAFW
jgi:hypothetical protein